MSFGLLAAESLRDAARRRVVIVVAVVSLFSLMFVDCATQCATGQVVVNDQARDLGELAGVPGAITFVMLGLWCIVLAGVLAAEHLAQSLSDGSANLTLARPVGRASFAAARLFGALAIAGVTAVVLLGTTGVLLFVRAELAAGPAALAGLAALLGSITVGALAMCASLTLPRVACVILAFALVGAMTIANGMGFVSSNPSGALAALDAAGPPLLTGMALSLDPWIPQWDVPADALGTWARLVVWAAGSVALLLVCFRRVELGR